MDVHHGGFAGRAGALGLQLFVGVEGVQRGAVDFAGGQVEGDASGAQPDHPGEVLQRQVHRVQAGQQGAAARGGLAVEQGQGMAGEHRVHGRDRFVGEDQLGALVEHPGDADPLQLAAGKLVAALEQLVAEIQALQRVVGAGAVQRIDQAGQALPQRPLAEASGQYRADHPLPWRQRRRLVDQADARAQALAGGGG